MSCKTKKCGCLDTGLTTPSPCPHDIYQCPNPDPCAETFSDCCIIHTGDTIVDLGIEQGYSLCQILQLLALWQTNPTCADPASACRSVLGLNSTVVTGTTIGLAWTSVGSPNSFQVEYREVSSFTWLLNPIVVAPTVVDTIGGLLLNSFYYIRVNAMCDTGTCYSVTILVKTKSA
jgi:hypothetical protein